MAQSSNDLPFAHHAGPRGRAAQPYAWLDSQPAYPADPPRLAQEGPSYLGGRAGQPASWAPATQSSWSLEVRQLALHRSLTAQQ